MDSSGGMAGRQDTLPTGTVTFLFTDIEGSTRLLDGLEDDYAQLLGDHGRIFRDAIGAGGGTEVGTEGDSFFAVFPTARGAALAAVTAQRDLARNEWPRGVSVRVRMGLHTGTATHGPDGYVGMDVHRAARIAAAGHGGQILLSAATAELVRDFLPDGVMLTHLGTHALRDLPQPERLCQVLIEGLRARLPTHTIGRRQYRQPPGAAHHLRRPGGGVGCVDRPGGQATAGDAGWLRRHREVPARHRGGTGA